MAWPLASFARNTRLVGEIDVELIQAEDEALRTGRPARRFKDFRYAILRQLVAAPPGRRQGGTDAWRSQSALRRHLADKARRRRAPPLRGDLLRARRDGNRIKECQGAFRQRHVETARSNDAPRDERKVLLPTITDPRGVDFQAYERLRQQMRRLRWTGA